MTLFRQNPETGVREAVNVPNSSGTTILKGAKLIEAENRIAELEAQIATAPAFENAADLATKVKQLLIAAKVREREAAAKAAALPIVHRAQLPIVAAAAVANPAGIVTAAEFSTKRPVMHQSEFSKLSPADKSRFVVESRGSVIPDPKPVSPQRDKQGNLTRAGLNAM